MHKLAFLAFIVVAGFGLYYVIVCNEPVAEEEITARYSIEQMKSFASKNLIANDFQSSYYTKWNFSFNRIMDDSSSRFNLYGKDVLVFIHIQKTAGTSFEKFLVRHLDIPSPCDCRKGRKRCTCRRPNRPNETWLFSRYSTGWICGLHADFTELNVSGCVDTALDKKEGSHEKRRYFYTSFLREPISRFISEYRHVHRGATWITSRHVCNGRPPTPDELPLCFDPQLGWDEVSLDEFIQCPFNLAFNRQTRMLADLTLVNCYSRNGMDSATRDRIMLQSAKTNLKNLAYYGLKDDMKQSQWMFEQVFGLRFNKNLWDWTKSKSNGTQVTKEQMEIIKHRNHLDIELYEFAENLFYERLRKLQEDNNSKDLSPITDANNTNPNITITDESSRLYSASYEDYA